MTTIVVSSEGQVVLPAALRRRLGLGTGTQLEVLEEADGVRLRVVRSVPSADLSGLAGMVSHGAVARSLTPLGGFRSGFAAGT